MNIKIKKGNLLEQKVDVIVNPANSSGYMGYGAAKAIAKEGGEIIEREAVNKAPLYIGDAIITNAGVLPFKGVIHTATLDDPNQEILSSNISKALLGAVLLADDLGFKSIAVPGMGTGAAGLDFNKAAKAMFLSLKKFKPRFLEQIVFVDLNDDMVKAWEKIDENKE